MSIAAKDRIDPAKAYVPYLDIKSLTWDKYTHGMFNYFERYIECQKLRGAHSFHMYRKDSEDKCYLTTKLSQVDSLILQAVYKDGYYNVGTNKSKNNYYTSAVWKPIRDYPVNKDLKLKIHRMKLGTIVKIGRFVFKVKDMSPFVNDSTHNYNSKIHDNDEDNRQENYQGSDQDNISDAPIPNITQPASENTKSKQISKYREKS